MKSIDKRVGTLMLSLALSVASVYAQTVDDICINNVRQLGGKEAAAKVKSLQLQETVVTEGSELQVTTLLVPGVAYYQRIKSPQGTSMVCAYGEQGWIFNSTPTPRTEQLPDGMAQTYIIGSKFLLAKKIWMVKPAMNCKQTISRAANWCCACRVKMA